MRLRVTRSEIRSTNAYCVPFSGAFTGRSDMIAATHDTYLFAMAAAP
jgi:hypothetical protein